MNIIIRLLIAGMMIIFCSLQSLAQSDSSFAIAGQVTDSVNGTAMPNATIQVRNNKNTQVSAGVTGSDGKFFIKTKRNSIETIEISAVGYRTKNIIVHIPPGTSTMRDFGPVKLIKTGQQLKEVVVNAAKPPVKQEIDRITYDLQADPQSKSSSVLEMMRKVPFVSLDAEENILLKGNSSYRIFINGRPSSMLERNAKEVLRSMPASSIQRIEIITNPPAKYDAEGLAGIINIVTQRKTGNGYNGSLNLSERFPVGGPGIGGSFAIKSGRLGISGNGGGSLYNAPNTINRLERKTTGNEQTNLVQEGSNRSKNRNGYFGTEISYEIDSLNLLSTQLNINGSKGSGLSSLQSKLTSSGVLSQRYHLANDNEGNGSGFDAAFNYQLGFKKDKNRLLTFSYRYFEYNNNQHTKIDIFNPLNFSQPDYQQYNDTRAAENTMQADYVQTYKKINMEAGLKVILRNNTSDFQYLAINPLTGKLEVDPWQTNQFNYTQNILGAYNTYQYIVKKWEFKAGARFEYTTINADFTSTATKVDQQYFNVIPSVAVKRSLKNNASLNFGYTQRIKRPGINRLNPFVDRSNPNYESYGNPALRPVLMNRFQLGYGWSKKLALNTGLDFSFVKNIDLRVSALEPATNITRSTYQNTGKASAVDYSLNLNYPFSKRWNGSLNSTLSYIWIEGFVGSTLVKVKWFLYSVNVSTGYRFDHGWRVLANLNLASRNPNSLQGTSNGMIISSFSVNKELVKNKLSVAAGVSNPFTKYRNNIFDNWGPGFTEVILNRNYFRQFNVSLNYNFGKLNQSIRKNKRGIRNDDVSEGKGL